MCNHVTIRAGLPRVRVGMLGGKIPDEIYSEPPAAVKVAGRSCAARRAALKPETYVGPGVTSARASYFVASMAAPARAAGN
jgi:hypothetical protein